MMRSTNLSEESDNTAVRRTPAFSGQPNKEEADHHEYDQEHKTLLSGRERLKRHREEVAGTVSIPEHWGKEGLLEGWIDFLTIDTGLSSKKIFSARAALMADAAGRGVSRQRLRIETSC